MEAQNMAAEDAQKTWNKAEKQRQLAEANAKEMNDKFIEADKAYSQANTTYENNKKNLSNNKRDS